ncbi:MAG: hypothetical protein FWE94_06625, partial [Coriobacteriia bacterium]|nr:hypothetical protein [Coriobacteriia bacterium]
QVAMLVSMVVMAPVSDLIGTYIERLAATSQLMSHFAGMTLTGSRITLQIAAVVVLVASAYGYRTLNWRGGSGVDR